MLYQVRLLAILSLLLATAAVANAEPRHSRTPTPAQLTAIAGWVSANSDIPYAEVAPGIEFVSPARLIRLRYSRVLSGPGQTIAGESPAQATGGEHSTPRPEFLRQVVAIYEDATETIYLSENWTGASKAEQSVLVHEMVHHLQKRARLAYACAGAREKPAYLAQKAWLESHGLDFAEELQVDMFTVVAMSACM